MVEAVRLRGKVPGMGALPGTWSVAAVSSNVMLALGLAAWLLASYRDPKSTWWLSQWAAVPGQLMALALVSFNWRRRDLHPDRRAAWAAVVLFVALNIISSLVWNGMYQDPRNPELILGDVLYLLDYLVLAASCLLFTRANGGFDQPSRFWRDVLTIAVAMVATGWTFLFEPYFLAPGTRALDVTTTSAYTLVITLLVSVATVTVIRSAADRHSWSVVLLATAALIDAGWEIAWVAGKFAGQSYVGLFYSYGDVLTFAVVCAAAVLERNPPVRAHSRRSVELNAYGFLPALTLMMILVLVAGSARTPNIPAHWVQFVLILLGASLLVARQDFLRLEVAHLHRQLVLHEADARVSELIEHSESLLLIVNRESSATFASPAMLRLLQSTQQDLPLPRSLWSRAMGNPAALDQVMADVRSDGRTAPVELTVDVSPEDRRVLLVSGVDQRHNEVIGGIVLSFIDVTAHRAMERDVVAAGARERLRLSSEVHEGLGQELTGIALMLRHVASSTGRPTNEWTNDVNELIGHVNRTIEMARQLAVELSPVSVARGSLPRALEKLVQESSARSGLVMQFVASGGSVVLDEDTADQLYRIAREAINNAMRHAHCTRVDIELSRLGSAVTLDVQDDGRGFRWDSGPGEGFGLRIMQYRSRMIGASLRIGPAERGGTQVRVEVRV